MYTAVFDSLEAVYAIAHAHALEELLLTEEDKREGDLCHYVTKYSDKYIKKYLEKIDPANTFANPII